MDLVFMYCPIREISVERGGTKVKRFFVFEARRDELGNLTEYRQSGTPGDCSGASFWYFLREKVLRGIRKLRNWIPAFAGMTEHARGGAQYDNNGPQLNNYAKKVLQNYSVC